MFTQTRSPYWNANRVINLVFLSHGVNNIHFFRTFQAELFRLDRHFVVKLDQSAGPSFAAAIREVGPL